jgi:hypothetical protein
METALKPNLRPSSFNAARNERMASACALPIVDLPHNDTPDTPALPAAKLVVAIATATTSSAAGPEPVSFHARR